ncbi:hypothetical protein CR513_39845, partial [Mucuna pruriens]
MTPFVLYGQEAHKGAHYRKIQHVWSNVVRKRAAWRTRSCGTSPSYRIWLENWVKLILPQELEAQGYEIQETLKVGKLRVTLEQVEAERKDLKRRLETSMEEVHRERQLNDETSKRARVERETRLKVGSCLRAVDKEMCARRVERYQVAIKKEQLEKTLLNIRIREAEQREQVHLLEEELARANLSKECLIDQRRKSVLELVKAPTKAEEDEAQYQETIRELERTLEGWKRRCQDMANSAKEQARVVVTEISFWKDRFIKLSWLANQALRDIPRSLRAVEGMADFVKTPKEISRFLGLCRELYDKIKTMATPP